MFLLCTFKVHLVFLMRSMYFLFLESKYFSWADFLRNPCIFSKWKCSVHSTERFLNLTQWFQNFWSEFFSPGYIRVIFLNWAPFHVFWRITPQIDPQIENVNRNNAEDWKNDNMLICMYNFLISNILNYLCIAILMFIFFVMS